MILNSLLIGTCAVSSTILFKACSHLLKCKIVASVYFSFCSSSPYGQALRGRLREGGERAGLWEMGCGEEQAQYTFPFPILISPGVREKEMLNLMANDSVIAGPYFQPSAWVVFYIGVNTCQANVPGKLHGLGLWMAANGLDFNTCFCLNVERFISVLLNNSRYLFRHQSF